MEKGGEGLYPHKFHVSISLENFLSKYDHLEKEQSAADEHTIAARVHAIRQSSSKLRFLDIRAEGVKLQVITKLAN